MTPELCIPNADSVSVGALPWLLGGLHGALL